MESNIKLEDSDNENTANLNFGVKMEQDDQYVDSNQADSNESTTTKMPKLFTMLVGQEQGESSHEKSEPVEVSQNTMPKLYDMLTVKVEPSEVHQDKENGEHERRANFQVNRNLIPAANFADQSMTDLLNLGLDVFNQEEFEQGVMEQIDEQLAFEEEERKRKAIEKEKKGVVDDIIMVQKELIKIDKLLKSSPAELMKSGPGINKRLEAARRQKENKLNQLKKLTARNKSLTTKLNGGTPEDGTNVQAEVQGGDLNQVLGLGPSTSHKETERERMIRLGEMTPFGTVTSAGKNGPKTASTKTRDVPAISLSQDSAFDMFLSEKDQQQVVTKKKNINKDRENTSRDCEHKPKHVSLPHKDKEKSMRRIQSESSLSKKRKENYFDKTDKRTYRNDVEGSSSFKSHRKKHKYPRLDHNFTEDGMMSGEDEIYGDNEEEEGYVSSDPEYRPPEQERERDAQNVTDDNEDDSSFKAKPKKRKLRKKIPVPEFDPLGDDESDSEGETKRRRYKSGSDVTLHKCKDDGDDYAFEKRIKDFNMAERLKQKKLEQGEESASEDDEEFDGGLQVPGRIWCKLFKYQKTGVRWLWELHQQEAGGIIGDEMGLGKTIQMIAFLAALRQSKLRSQHFRYVGIGPTLIVCPTTVMHQWVKEFHKWWPLFRVGILHSSGTYTGSEKELVRTIAREHGVIITSYSSLVIHQDILLQYNWHYVVLDEGHKIRNPDAQATLVCKQFRTPHRIILSGSPIQNNLKELWSLFDFVFPGKLGTLPDFMAHFSVPIVQGGYASASQIQVTTAYKCACVLRDTINPYLLRRMKADVNINLPSKNEQVLFCRLADEQREVYKEYLQSRECQAILQGKFQVFAGLIMLRKICNHPDLSTGGPRVFVGDDIGDDETLEFGYLQRSGKMIVVEALLRLWKKQGHRVVLFSQSRSMLDILESFVQKQNYSYLRMDGGTSIGSRQPMIDRFNKDKTLFLFLLTTRVGGLGVNLVGANRVIIFDPDWNPSTDTQARERTWRIGQKRNVTIYRLITSGTIEEKIYHRQIFKQFLANRVLKDPKQRRFFKANDLYELFDLGVDDSKGGTETAAIFAGIGSEIKRSDLKVNKPHFTKKSDVKINRFDKIREKKEQDSQQEEEDIEYFFEESEVKKMRDLAKMLSQKLVGGSKSENKGVPNGKHSSTVVHTDMPEDKSVSNGKHKSVESNGEVKRESKESHKRKKKHKKRHKGAKFEGERIPNLVKHGEYKPAKTSEQDEKMNSEMDDYVLKKLFQKSGIQGALKHEVIMDPTKHDYMIVEAEADKVAKEAMAALKRSRSQCAGPLSGLPTWTGQHGSISKKPRFGQKKNSLLVNKQDKPSSTSTAEKSKSEESLSMSKRHMFDGTLAGSVVTNPDTGTSGNNVLTSNELLIRMKHRNEISQKPDGNDEESTSGAVDSKDFELLTELRNYIMFECNLVGKASTQELLDKFESKLPPTDSVKFKAMLNEICDFERNNDIGFWKLRGEFR